MVKIALVGNYTIDYLKRPLSKELAAIPHEIYISGYDQINQEILNRDSALYQFGADVIFVMLQPDKLSPDLLQLLETLGANTDAKIIVNNFYIPFYSPLDIGEAADVKASLARINMELHNFARERSNFFIFDYCGFVGHYGRVNVFDNRFYYLSKTYESQDYLPQLAREYMRYIYAALGMRKKCLVLDLDNTLWGGIIGEDGISGITLARDGVGKAYWDFQEAILALHKRGIVLALCSKNNLDEALEAIDKHPDMLLRSQYFAAMQINWDDKATNIRKIAAELNLGLDSFVFMDDSPFERELVRKMLPELTVIDMPEDAAYYAYTLNALNCFSAFYITEEDSKRNRQYMENAARRTEAAKYADIESYLKSLEMELTIAPPDDFTITRVHQLINKTNQFNMTSIRYSMEDLQAMRQSADYKIFCISLKDKFGDNGLVGVVILHHCGLDPQSRIYEIDTFLLSCRVLGRRVEEAILDHLLSLCGELRAKFIPSKKNLAYADVYVNYGFQEIGHGGEAVVYSIEAQPAKSVELFRVTSRTS